MSNQSNDNNSGCILIVLSAILGYLIWGTVQTKPVPAPTPTTAQADKE